MVRLHVKKGDESQFLFDTTVEIPIEQLLKELVPIYNGRQKVIRICGEMGELAGHGVTLPPNMQGLADDQIEELKLKDEWGDKCEPSGGHVFKKDDIGRRNGKAPNDQMKAILEKTMTEAKDMISKKKVQMDELLPLAKVQEAVDILRGAATIVYPMGLPPYDPIRLEFENNEDLEGTQAVLDVFELDKTSLWWAGKELIPGKLLKDFVGKNEKTKIVCKLQKKGGGPPAREAVVGEEEQKAMMAHYYRKQEEWKKLETQEDDTSFGSRWADTQALRRDFHGLKDIKLPPGRRY